MLPDGCDRVVLCMRQWVNLRPEPVAIPLDMPQEAVPAGAPSEASLRARGEGDKQR